jgi:hypothetical protein
MLSGMLARERLAVTAILLRGGNARVMAREWLAATASWYPPMCLRAAREQPAVTALLRTHARTYISSMSNTTRPPLRTYKGVGCLLTRERLAVTAI